LNEILYEISWQNLLMMIATIEPGEKKKTVTVEQLETLLS